ncbi:hypothetical protein IscW_ISCW015844 [Ixodes scapularis]|uniref:Ig-like domain-containing protein n=1 Tax=Ixodes scapularis TaxID=6945 RepID=B7P1H7_IXOSC|nr:hypothetical protein IscW_ISCW015844 [Ixodes scapularis]|eukprot:XP_002433385.1 hypothetical protein IscW_ISCW015844 [Ixodes scapularis]
MRDDGTWLLQDESVYLSTVGNNYMATFKNVSERDYGNYSCVSHNKYGMSIDTVELSGKPKVTTLLQWTSHLNGSISAKLVCTSYSSKSSNTRWIRDDGTPLLNGGIAQLSISNNSYAVTFKDVGEAHYGNYTCVSHSEWGISRETVVLSGESAQDLRRTFPDSKVNVQITGSMSQSSGTHDPTRAQIGTGSRNLSSANTTEGSTRIKSIIRSKIVITKEKDSYTINV